MRLLSKSHVSNSPPEEWANSSLQSTRSLLLPFGNWLRVNRATVNKDEVPDYYNVIETPMDLSTMEERLEHDKYATPRGLVDGLKLIFSKYQRYNDATTAAVQGPSHLGIQGGSTTYQSANDWKIVGKLSEHNSQSNAENYKDDPRLTEAWGLFECVNTRTTTGLCTKTSVMISVKHPSKRESTVQLLGCYIVGFPDSRKSRAADVWDPEIGWEWRLSNDIIPWYWKDEGLAYHVINVHLPNHYVARDEDLGDPRRVTV
ncbi:bromodomain-containing protein, putative [Talaromyces stipitatus ATCC 10500]|uniref:Bromodomain-containing protein, putative n=1 Tax=Talaromyces stipitatus (strain ATCC 10500 / CBS 375.48 / QM 6759 / NRRL 1006) TaxID=441959 RepID=B8MCF6_TALSN|nr:bromodomain-containing protein, putative [Talaromyces stipitatus ATCC 10500]EED18772.1 bromodomain-containing protein, putative [Talaromyces stipitatus ATCC 10500]